MVTDPATLESIPESIAGVPEWIEPSFSFRKGADPLGFQTITTDRVIGRLLPGILALSERARYFSFYAFLLARRRQRLPRRKCAGHPATARLL